MTPDRERLREIAAAHSRRDETVLPPIIASPPNTGEEIAASEVFACAPNQRASTIALHTRFDGKTAAEWAQECDQLAVEIKHLNQALTLKLDALPSGLSAGQSMKMQDELDRRRLWMEREDARPCDIAACNCRLWHWGEKSWHARYVEAAELLIELNTKLADIDLGWHRP